MNIINQIRVYFVLLLFWIWISLVGKCSFFIQNFVYNEDAGFLLSSQAFYKGILLDFSLAGYLMIPAILLMFFVKPAFFKTFHRFYFYIFGVLVLFINQIDTVLFGEWGTRINFLALIYAQHPAEAFASADTKMMLFSVISLCIVFLILHFSVNFFLKRINPEFLANQSRLKTGLILIPLFGLNFLFIRGSIDKVPINQSVAYYTNIPLLNQTAVNGAWNLVYYLFNPSSGMSEQVFSFMSDEEAEKIVNEMHKSPDVMSNETWFDENEKPNIIFLVLESFTFEAVKSAGGSLNLTPSFDSMTEEGLLFTQMYASGDRTDKGLVALLSGFPSQPFTSIMTEPAKSIRLPSIVRDLSSEGYSNLFMYGGNSSFANMRSYLHSTGFNKIVDQNNLSVKTTKGAWGFHDQDLFASLKKEIQNLNEPYFVTALTLSSHHPFDYPKEGVKNFDDQEPFLSLKTSLRYTDSCLHDFWNWFKSQNSYQNSLVVIVADHGHPIGENEHVFFGLHKFRIPCLILGKSIPDSLKGYKINHPVSQHCIAPFILEKLALKNKSDYLFYKNPLDKKNPFSWYSFYTGTGWIDEEHGFLYYFENEVTELLKGDEVPENKVKKIKALQQNLLEKYLFF